MYRGRRNDNTVGQSLADFSWSLQKDSWKLTIRVLGDYQKSHLLLQHTPFAPQAAAPAVPRLLITLEGYRP